MIRNRQTPGAVLLTVLACLALQVRADEPVGKTRRPTITEPEFQSLLAVDGVRHLKVDPHDLRTSLRGGGHDVKVLKSREEIEKVAGKEAAESLAKRVDFSAEWIVFVSWSTGGPPFGFLKYEIRQQGAARQIEFYVVEPLDQQRGSALRVGADFFAVPRDVTVKTVLGWR
jgi:hypothetical protein